MHEQETNVRNKALERAKKGELQVYGAFSNVGSVTVHLNARITGLGIEVPPYMRGQDTVENTSENVASQS